MELSELKRNEKLLLAVLGRDAPGQHLRCAFHEEASGSMSVWCGSDGVWLWKCHAGCGGGTVIDAAMKRYSATGAADALRAIERELGVKIGRDEDYQEPVIDMERAERLVQAAHETLLSDFGIQEEYLAGKRGIHDLEIVKRYRLGFVRNASFPEFYSWRLTGWILPITSASGSLVAVKIHQERKPDPANKKIPKCLWAPFGTMPAKDPKHGTSTLWPAPEAFRGCEVLVLAPGELKALALIGAGCPATSPTVGESKLQPRNLERLVRCQPRAIAVAWDNDPAGRNWRDAVVAQISATGIRAYAVDPRKKAPPATELPAAAPEVAPAAMPCAHATSEAVSVIQDVQPAATPPGASQRPSLREWFAAHIPLNIPFPGIGRYGMADPRVFYPEIRRLLTAGQEYEAEEMMLHLAAIEKYCLPCLRGEDASCTTECCASPKYARRRA